MAFRSIPGGLFGPARVPVGRGLRGRKLGDRRDRRPHLGAVPLESRLALSSSTVTDTSDDPNDPGSLRYAIAQANASRGAAEIHFKLPTTAPATIVLTHGQLELSNTTAPKISIVGPGAGLLAIDGNATSRIFQIDKGVNATISGSSLVHGSNSLGGAIFNEGTLTVLQSQFLNNTAPPINIVTHFGGAYGPGLGGAIVNYKGTLSLDDCILTGNSANDGGAIQEMDLYGASASLSLDDCTLSGNSALLYTSPGGRVQLPNGGAINIENLYSKVSVTLTDCTVSGNTAGGKEDHGYGGGIVSGAFFGSASQTDLTLTDCTISDNSTGGVAGGLLNFNGGLTMTGCTVSGNSAEAGGGLGVSGPSALTNCTVSGNTAGQGGGIEVYGAGPLSLVACTISGNTATSTTTASGNPGGGVFGANYQGITPTATLTDTIVAGNRGPMGKASDISGDPPFQATGSYNLIGTGGSGGLKASDHNLLNVADPGLAPLGDYGGPTQTMALLPGSPAIHNGVAVAGVKKDQRGFPLDHPVDIGAFQSRPGQLVVDAAIQGLGIPPGNSAGTDGGPYDVGSSLVLISTSIARNRGGHLLGQVIHA